MISLKNRVQFDGGVASHVPEILEERDPPLVSNRLANQFSFPGSEVSLQRHNAISI